MLPWIVGAVVVGVGAYLLDNAESNNKRAINEYNDTYDKVKKDTKKAYENAQKKDMLDKLFKIKKVKRQIADNIYKELKNFQNNFKQINIQLKESKETLTSLFTKKKLTTTKKQKMDIQKNINIIINSRKEIFKIKDELKSDIDKLKLNLKKANYEVKNIQEEINRVLEG